VCQIPIKGCRCLREQETLSLLLSTGWFQVQIRALFHNRTKKMTFVSNKYSRKIASLPITCMSQCIIASYTTLLEVEVPV